MGYYWKVFKKHFLEQPKAENKFGTGLKFEQPEVDEPVYFGLTAPTVDWNVGRDLRKIMSARLIMNNTDFNMHYLKGDDKYKDILAYLKQHNVPDYNFKIWNQNSSSSCVAQAILWYQTAKNFLENQKWEDLSPKDLYPYIRLWGGGAHISHGFNRKNNIGAVTEIILEDCLLRSDKVPNEPLATSNVGAESTLI